MVTFENLLLCTILAVEITTVIIATKIWRSFKEYKDTKRTKVNETK